MNTRSYMDFPADAILSADETDAPIAEWTIDELYQFSDLDSVRLAWTRTDSAPA